MNTKVLTTLEYTKSSTFSQRRPTPSPVKTMQRAGAFYRPFRHQNSPAGDQRCLGPSLPYWKHLFWQQQRSRIFDPFSGNRQFSVYVRIVEACILLDNVSRIKTYGKKNGKTSQMTVWMPTLKALLL